MSQIPHALASVKADGSRLPIFPSDVKGRFIRARRAVFTALIAFYVAAPLLRLGHHALVHLDVADRRFYLFGQTFNAQDVWLLGLLAVTGIFGLLFVTTWRGRLWCGWACPQTVFLEAVFRPLERLIDGPRERRLKQLQAGWSVGRGARAVLKHTLYLFAAFLLAHVAVALFLSREELFGSIADGPLKHSAAFAWSMTMTALLYFDFAWFREQFCVVMCPYGRLQSVMHDRDSIIIGYDARRGEPRGPLKKPGFGDCIDCRKCVTACPTAIDIRNGLQMECLACAQCVDACDEVMGKIGKPRGLIRYASLTELEGQPHRVLRPRLLIYAGLMVLFGSAFGLAIGLRTPFEANLVRLPGPPYVVDEGKVRNALGVHLINKSPQRRVYRLTATAAPAVQVQVEPAELELGSLESARISVVAFAPLEGWTSNRSLSVTVVDDEGARREQSVPLLGPAH